MAKEFEHVPVMLKEVLENLNIREDGTYVDGTLGGAGHSFEIRKRLTSGSLIGFDQDEDALKFASERLSCYDGGVTIIRSNYENAVSILREKGIPGADGILLDIGVSSYQLDEESRGFTYRTDDAPLDMRMDKAGTLTAGEILNGYSVEELTRILRDYGEERFAGNIAKNIVLARQQSPLKTTGQLNEIVKNSIPAKVRATGGHPSKRTFQALRIAVNRELEVLDNSIDKMADFLNPGGRLCIITFHSLEDRIVKNHFRNLENPCTCPPSFPVCVCGKVSKGRVITKHPILPDDIEMETNPRSKSAKLRVFEKK